MSPPTGKGARELGQGAVLQCVEAATLGMPFEIWKTRMGSHRTETTLQSFRAVYNTGGPSAFWRGTGPKMVESASKGAILMYSKEMLLDVSRSLSINPTASGIIAGAGGGVFQTVVMGPCTFLVTAIVAGDRSITTTQRIKTIWAQKGIRGFYPGGTAIALRQASNWASRQGFTEFVRSSIQDINHNGDRKARLTVREEVFSGIAGGLLSSWNHPFEVARIEMQARAERGQSKMNIVQVLKHVHEQHGAGGLFKGIIPRIGLGVWQTLFMVTGAKLVRQWWE